VGSVWISEPYWAQGREPRYCDNHTGCITHNRQTAIRNSGSVPSHHCLVNAELSKVRCAPSNFHEQFAHATEVAEMAPVLSTHLESSIFALNYWLRSLYRPCYYGRQVFPEQLQMADNRFTPHHSITRVVTLSAKLHFSINSSLQLDNL
jgi:hypothetical protein